MSRSWVGAASFRAASTPSSLRSTTSLIGSTALSPTMTLCLLLIPPWLSPPPPTSLATCSRNSSSSCLAESSSPFSSLPNSLTLRSPYDVIPRIFCFNSTIARWVDMEGDLVFCSVAFGLDLGSWLLLLLLGWHFLEKRKRERCCWCCYIWDLSVVFLSEFDRRKESVCMWVFFSFFLGFEFVFLLFLFKTHLDLNSYDF